MARRKQREGDAPLLMALACGATVEVAARNANVSPATVYRRLQDRHFQEQLQQTRADMVHRTSATLTAAAGEAVKTLLALQKENVPASTRLGAARSILELGMKLREVSELEERLAALEGKGEFRKAPSAY